MFGRLGQQQPRTGSLRRQYLMTLGSLVAVCAVTALICAAAVVWAAKSMEASSERITQLQLANRDIFQNMTDAENGLHSFALSEQESSLARYNTALNYLPLSERRLRDHAEGDDRLLEAAEVQEQAIREWLTGYADLQLEDRPRSADDRRLLLLGGNALFDDVRVANQDVSDRVEALVGDIEDRTRVLILLVLGAVVLLPGLVVAWVVTVVRRMGDTVVRPLTDISDVLGRLRAGELDARAPVAGPEEIRQIAAALNLLTDENVRAGEVEADVLNQLEAIDRVRTDLVSTVSHELRTPLTSIAGYLELLQDDLEDRLSPQQSTMMGAVRRNLDRLAELIDNLLALSRAEETAFQLEPVDLRGIAAEVASDVRLTAGARDITVRTRQSGAPVVVLGDRSQLIRAVQNLVTNAVKFSRPGGLVELRVRNEQGEAVLEVADEGIGIPAVDLPQLGSRFYRARNAVKAEISGTGLGLRIVQTILDRHEGALAVDSVEGEGATFTLRLPTSTRPYGSTVDGRRELPGAVASPARELTRD